MTMQMLSDFNQFLIEAKSLAKNLSAPIAMSIESVGEGSSRRMS